MVSGADPVVVALISPDAVVARIISSRFDVLVATDIG